MRIAIILTGALRTIKKTIRYFKDNLLTANAHNEVNVFVCVQNDTQEPEAMWTKWFEEQIPCITHFIWFSNEHYPQWALLRDHLLTTINESQGWKDYLKNSGSMIEYYQLHLAYMRMQHHEQTFRFEYDYVVRARTDSIYAKPVDFHWLNWTDEEIQMRLDTVEQELQLSNIAITPDNLLSYFMSTIISDDLIPNIQHIMADYYPSSDKKQIRNTVLDWRNYIQNGRYILTIRKNNLYIVRRELFHMIPALGTMYGAFRSPHSDHYWFNAECQFLSACYHSQVSIHNYSSLFEERSLEYAHSWNEADFFDLEFNCIHSRMLYCVVRK